GAQSARADAARAEAAGAEAVRAESVRAESAGAIGGTGLAEGRRLLVVAMTRARTHLFLTCAARRRRHSTVTETGPSPFLASIDPPLLDPRAVPPPRRPEVSQPRLL